MATTNNGNGGGGITALSIINVVAYAANTLIVYGVGAVGLFQRIPTNAELSEKYQTIITPVSWTFAIWAIIFGSQLLFAITQLLWGRVRNDLLVTRGVAYNYVWVCLAQIGWTLTFGFEIIYGSVAAMTLILVFLVLILRRQQYVIVHQEQKQQEQQQSTSLSSSIISFVFARFPFAIHAGWIVAAWFLNVSVLLVDLGVSAEGQTIAAYVSLGGLLVASLIALWGRPKKTGPGRTSEYVAPLAIAWASFGIYAELDNPKDKITNAFSDNNVSNIQNGAFYASIIIVALVVLVFLWNVIASFRGGRNNEAEEGGGTYVKTDKDGMIPSTTV